MAGRFAGVAIAVLCCLLAVQVMAADIYVNSERGANKKGEGTQASPYKNIEYAVEKADEGDSIHIAAGRYVGMARSGRIIITKSNLTFVGGYADDFGARDPFANITLLEWDDSPDNKTEKWPGAIFNATQTEDRKPLAGIVVDGLTIDGGSRNPYMTDPADPSLEYPKAPSDPLMSILVDKDAVGVVRNCTFLNPGKVCCLRAASMPGGKYEVYNNIFVNSVYFHLDLVTRQNRKLERADFDVHHNTFAFSWRINDANGSAVYVNSYVNAAIHDNILAYGDMYAVKNQKYEKQMKNRIPVPGYVNEHVSMDRNLAYMFARGIYGYVRKGQSGLLSATRLDELEDTSLASAEGNVVGDPGLVLNKAWMQMYLDREDAAVGEITPDSLNSIRAALGLPVQVEGAKAKYYAMRYPLADAMKLRAPGAEQAKGIGAGMTAIGEVEAQAQTEEDKAARIQALQEQIKKLQAELEALQGE